MSPTIVEMNLTVRIIPRDMRTKPTTSVDLLRSIRSNWPLHVDYHAFGFAQIPPKHVRIGAHHAAQRGVESRLCTVCCRRQYWRLTYPPCSSCNSRNNSQMQHNRWFRMWYWRSTKWECCSKVTYKRGSSSSTRSLAPCWFSTRPTSDCTVPQQYGGDTSVPGWYGCK